VSRWSNASNSVTRFPSTRAVSAVEAREQKIALEHDERRDHEAEHDRDGLEAMHVDQDELALQKLSTRPFPIAEKRPNRNTAADAIAYAAATRPISEPGLRPARPARAVRRT
jgi:hypothetical protein